MTNPYSTPKAVVCFYCRVKDELSVVILSVARSTALRVNSVESKNLRSFDCATNDEFCKLVNFSVFEKSIFSSGSQDDKKRVNTIVASLT